MAGQVGSQGLPPAAGMNQAQVAGQNLALPGTCDIPNFGVVEACMFCSRRVARMHVEVGNPSNAHHEQCHQVARRVHDQVGRPLARAQQTIINLQTRNQTLEARNQTLELEIAQLRAINYPPATASVGIGVSPSTSAIAHQGQQSFGAGLGQMNRGRRFSLPSSLQTGGQNAQCSNPANYFGGG